MSVLDKMSLFTCDAGEQVLIRWALQRGTSVLPKSVHPDRLRANLDVLEWSIPKEDFERLSSFPHQQRMVRLRVLCLCLMITPHLLLLYS
jgi:diketogulonate reductase-like aldo/keto reductase